MEYQIQPNTRRCAINGRALQPGERYYAALIEDGVQFERRDYSAEAWQGPPVGAFSFWAGRVPPPDAQARPRFDDDLLEECFQRLEGQTDAGRVNFRYVVALLLVRRRRFKLEAGDADANATMTVRCGSDRRAPRGDQPAVIRGRDAAGSGRGLPGPGLELK